MRLFFLLLSFFFIFSRVSAVTLEDLSVRERQFYEVFISPAPQYRFRRGLRFWSGPLESTPGFDIFVAERFCALTTESWIKFQALNPQVNEQLEKGRKFLRTLVEEEIKLFAPVFQEWGKKVLPRLNSNILLQMLKKGTAKASMVEKFLILAQAKEKLMSRNPILRSLPFEQWDSRSKAALDLLVGNLEALELENLKKKDKVDKEKFNLWAKNFRKIIEPLKKHTFLWSGNYEYSLFGSFNTPELSELYKVLPPEEHGRKLVPDTVNRELTELTELVETKLNDSAISISELRSIKSRLEGIFRFYAFDYLDWIGGQLRSFSLYQGKHVLLHLASLADERGKPDYERTLKDRSYYWKKRGRALHPYLPFQYLMTPVEKHGAKGREGWKRLLKPVLFTALLGGALYGGSKLSFRERPGRDLWGSENFGAARLVGNPDEIPKISSWLAENYPLNGKRRPQGIYQITLGKMSEMEVPRFFEDSSDNHGLVESFSFDAEVSPGASMEFSLKSQKQVSTATFFTAIPSPQGFVPRVRVTDSKGVNITSRVFKRNGGSYSFQAVTDGWLEKVNVEIDYYRSNRSSYVPAPLTENEKLKLKAAAKILQRYGFASLGQGLEDISNRSTITIEDISSVFQKTSFYSTVPTSPVEKGKMSTLDSLCRNYRPFLDEAGNSCWMCGPIHDFEQQFLEIVLKGEILTPEVDIETQKKDIAKRKHTIRTVNGWTRKPGELKLYDNGAHRVLKISNGPASVIYDSTAQKLDPRNPRGSVDEWYPGKEFDGKVPFFQVSKYWGLIIPPLVYLVYRRLKTKNRPRSVVPPPQVENPVVISMPTGASLPPNLENLINEEVEKRQRHNHAMHSWLAKLQVSETSLKNEVATLLELTGPNPEGANERMPFTDLISLLKLLQKFVRSEEYSAPTLTSLFKIMLPSDSEFSGDITDRDLLAVAFQYKKYLAVAREQVKNPNHALSKFVGDRFDNNLLELCEAAIDAVVSVSSFSPLRSLDRETIRQEILSSKNPCAEVLGKVTRE